MKRRNPRVARPRAARSTEPRKRAARAPQGTPPGFPFPCDDALVGQKVSGADFAGRVVGCSTPPPGKRGRFLFVGGGAVSVGRVSSAEKASARTRAELAARWDGEPIEPPARPIRRQTRQTRQTQPVARPMLQLPAPRLPQWSGPRMLVPEALPFMPTPSMPSMPRMAKPPVAMLDTPPRGVRTMAPVSAPSAISAPSWLDLSRVAVVASTRSIDISAPADRKHAKDLATWLGMVADIVANSLPAGEASILPAVSVPKEKRVAATVRVRAAESVQAAVSAAAAVLGRMVPASPVLQAVLEDAPVRASKRQPPAPPVSVSVSFEAVQFDRDGNTRGLVKTGEFIEKMRKKGMVPDFSDSSGTVRVEWPNVSGSTPTYTLVGLFKGIGSYPKAVEYALKLRDKHEAKATPADVLPLAAPPREPWFAPQPALEPHRPFGPFGAGTPDPARPFGPFGPGTPDPRREFSTPAPAPEAAIHLSSAISTSAWDIEDDQSVADEKAGWSDFQRRIFRWIKNSTGNAVVVARAGTGKTYTTVEAVKRIPNNQSVVVLAFNRNIRDELASRIKLPNVAIRTLNGHGFNTLNKYWGPLIVPNEDDEKAAIMQDEARRNVLMVKARVPPPMAPYQRQSRLIQKNYSEDQFRSIQSEWNYSFDKLVGKGGKGGLLDLCRSYLAVTPDAVKAVMQEFNLFLTKNKSRYSKEQVPWSFFDPRFNTEYTQDTVAGWIVGMLHANLSRPEDGRSARFDNVFPVAMFDSMEPDKFDWVFVDETQDMDAGQLKIVLKSVKPGGRIMVVGDDRQAIYRFRGADFTAIPRMIKELDAEVLKLSRSYRVPACIVPEVRQIVPDFEVPTDAPMGTCDTVPATKMAREWRPGDLVISYTNAPLLPLALKALAQGIPTYMLGGGSDLSNIVSNVVRQVQRNHDFTTKAGFLKALALEEKAVSRELIEDEERYIDKINTERKRRGLSRTDRLPEDSPKLAEWKLACLGVSAVAERTETIDEIEKFFREMASKKSFDELGPKAREVLFSTRLVFTTVHKIKGGEANTTWVLRETFKYQGPAVGFPNPKDSDIREGERAEAINLYYVAITRAKNERGDPAKGIPPKPGRLFFVEDLKYLLGQDRDKDRDLGTE